MSDPILIQKHVQDGNTVVAHLHPITGLIALNVTSYGGVETSLMIDPNTVTNDGGRSSGSSQETRIIFDKGNRLTLPVRVPGLNLSEFQGILTTAARVQSALAAAPEAPGKGAAAPRAAATAQAG
jgi:hypothetical protein